VSMSSDSIIDGPLASAPLARPTRNFGGAGRLALIVAVHVGFVAAIASGVTTPAPRAAAATPVMVTFVAPAPAPQPIAKAEPIPPQPKPQPKPEPKPQPKPKVVKPKPAPAPLPPSEKAIEAPSVPPPPPPAEPALAPAAAPAPAPATPPPGPPQPPSTPPPQGPKTITSGIAYLYNPPPAYPALARRLREEGTVVLRVLVNERGIPERVEVQTSAGSPRLDEAARRTVMIYRFEPQIENGRAVAMFAIIPVRFQLDS